MVQLAFVMRILSVLCKCVKANSSPEEGDEKNETECDLLCRQSSQ